MNQYKELINGIKATITNTGNEVDIKLVTDKMKAEFADWGSAFEFVLKNFESKGVEFKTALNATEEVFNKAEHITILKS